MAAYSITFLCTLCIYAALQVPGTSALDEGIQSEIVDKHNDLRRGVQPTASNMLKMGWSSAAAAKAQEWADGCSMEHSTSEYRKIDSIKCGENLFMSSSERGWDEAIQAWYNESHHYEYGKGSTNGKAVGHYTQVHFYLTSCSTYSFSQSLWYNSQIILDICKTLVWYRSNEVGCGMTYCPDKGRFKYVCIYCPTGNTVGQNPYKLGPSCDDCPDACDNKLCTNPCPYLDPYTNCGTTVAQYGCKNSLIAKYCPGSCNCKTEII